MKPRPQRRIPATYMRGGTSKGVFFRLQDLPAAAQEPGPERDALLLRVIGSPDPYGKHTDGMGGATSQHQQVRDHRAGIQSRTMMLTTCMAKSASTVPSSTGVVTAATFSSAVGPFAIANGFIPAERIPRDGVCSVRIWQKNIGKTIVAHVPIANGEVQEDWRFRTRWRHVSEC